MRAEHDGDKFRGGEGEGGCGGKREGRGERHCSSYERAHTDTKLVHTSARVVHVAVSPLQVSFTFYMSHLLSTVCTLLYSSTGLILCTRVSDRDEIGAHEALDGSGVEVAHKQIHVMGQLPAAMQKVGETFDRHVGQREE